MTLELPKLTGQLQAMGADLALRARQQADLVEMARRWLREYAYDRHGPADQLRHPARTFRAAAPTDEPINSIVSNPGTPERLTVIGVDGSQIEPDRHGVAVFHLVNIGILIYRHGTGQAPEAQTHTTLGYIEDDIFEDGRLVAGNLLDVRRDLDEITHVANACEAETRSPAAQGGSVPVLGLVDGTLLLWVLDDRYEAGLRGKVPAYLEQLDRIRHSGAVVCAFASRPRHADVARLLHLISVGGDPTDAARDPNPLQRIPDRAVFEILPAGARSALFVSPSQTNLHHYQPAGHAIHFCYINVAEQGHDPVIARVEMPEWVAQDPAGLRIVHGAVVGQARITGGFPYALARADELAFISGQEREVLSGMVTTALLRAGVLPSLSPKASQKAQMRGWRGMLQ